MLGQTGLTLIAIAVVLSTFTAVNASNVRLAKRTEGARRLSATGTAACVAAFGALMVHTAARQPLHPLVLAALLFLSFLIELAWSFSENRGLNLS